jgi:hypothetical protein
MSDFKFIVFPYSENKQMYLSLKENYLIVEPSLLMHSFASEKLLKFNSNFSPGCPFLANKYFSKLDRQTVKDITGQL